MHLCLLVEKKENIFQPYQIYLKSFLSTLTFFVLHNDAQKHFLLLVVYCTALQKLRDILVRAKHCRQAPQPQEPSVVTEIGARHILSLQREPHLTLFSLPKNKDAYDITSPAVHTCMCAKSCLKECFYKPFKRTLHDQTDFKENDGSESRVIYTVYSCSSAVSNRCKFLNVPSKQCYFRVRFKTHFNGQKIYF